MPHSRRDGRCLFCAFRRDYEAAHEEVSRASMIDEISLLCRAGRIRFTAMMPISRASRHLRRLSSPLSRLYLPSPPMLLTDCR